MVVPDFLRQMLYGLILPALLIHILDGLIFKIVFLFWQVLKDERGFLKYECSDKTIIKKTQQ